MFKKGSSLGELFGIKQQQSGNSNSSSLGNQSQQQQQQQQSPSTIPRSIQDLAKFYDRAKDLLDKTRQRNSIGFENNPDIEKRQFSRINEIRRLTNAMKTSVNNGGPMFEDVNEKMAWEQQIKYFEEDLESAVEVAVKETSKIGGDEKMTSTTPNPAPMFAGLTVAASNTPHPAFSPPVNDLRTPEPEPSPVVDLFAGLNVTPTPAAAASPAMEITTTTTAIEDDDKNKADDDKNKSGSSVGFGLQPVALPLDEDAFGDFRDASSAANETIVVPPVTTSTVVEPSVQPLDDDDEDGFFPREEAAEIPSIEEQQEEEQEQQEEKQQEQQEQQQGLTSGLDDALDESDDFLEDDASAMPLHEAVISPPAVVESHPINPPVIKAVKSAMLRIPSFSENEDVPIGNSPGAKRFQQKTKFAQEAEAKAKAAVKGEEEKRKVSSVEGIANSVATTNNEAVQFSASKSPDDSPGVSTPVLSPSHSDSGGGGGGSVGDSASLKRAESEPFTPVYSRVATPSLELSPDARGQRSPGSPMVFNSQDEDFILQSFGVEKVALDLEVADEFNNVVVEVEKNVRMCRLLSENAQRLKMEASNQRLSSATKATQHLKRISELQKEQDEAIRNDDFELAAEVEDKLKILSKELKIAEDALNTAELSAAERVRASLSALTAWANAEIEASNIINKFVSDKEEKWVREKDEKSRESVAKMSELEEKRKAAETKVNELKEALKCAEAELERIALESMNAEKANQLRTQGGKSSEREELGKIKETAELYRSSGSQRLQTTEQSSTSDELQQLVIHETTNTILSSEAQSELKREESDNARINADLANALAQESDCLSRVTTLERRKNELLALKQTHAAAKEFKEASECVNTLNSLLPELENLNDSLAQKRKMVENLQLQFSESETKVRLCADKFHEAERVCAQSRKLRLQTELNTKNSSEDETEVKALQCALELLSLKYPDEEV